MTSYDAFAQTFSNSRKNMKWAELEYIIEDIVSSGYTSILDIGCGNGRFLEQLKGKKDDNSLPGFGGGNLSKNSSAKNNIGEEFSSGEEIGNAAEQSEKGASFSSPNSFGTFSTKSTGNGVGKDIRYLGIDSSNGMIEEARKLHPCYNFSVCDMTSLSSMEDIGTFDTIVFLASFHHLETREDRIQVLRDIQKLLAPNGSIYMTNWNLREQPRYEKSHRGNGDFDIKIGEFSRYYHGFKPEELSELFRETGWDIIENRIFEGGRNIYSKIMRN